MTDWTPDEEQDEEGDAEVVRVITAAPVALRLVVTEHPRAPSGHTVFRTLGALEGEATDESPVLAQGSLPTPTFDAVATEGVFKTPAPLLLTAQDDGGGIRATLAALVSTATLERIERAQRAAQEPWLASLGESADDVVAAAGAHALEEADDDEKPKVAPFLLGVVLRFPEDRKFPGDLEHEAVDLLGTLLSGGAMDADRKRVENLLRSL